MSDNTNAGSPEDEALMVELRVAASRLDPLPGEAVLAARSAFAYRTMDAELAELTADRVAGEEYLAGVRGVDTPTILTFNASELTLEVEVSGDGNRRRLLGQLVPAQSGRVDVCHRSGQIRVSADEVGRFTADDVPPGPTSLRCQTVGGGLVQTDWFLV